MIWPEFLDECLNVISEDDRAVPVSGSANMWVIVDERRAYHRDKIEVGTVGYFMEGSWRVAVCTDTEIMGLTV
jgi:hypothetical protein